MALVIKKSANVSSSGGFLSMKELKDYPLLLVNTLRTGTKPNHFDNTKTNDYIIADVLALNSESTVVLNQKEVMVDQGRNKKGGIGSFIGAVFEVGIHVGTLSKGEKQIDPYIWDDVDLTPEQEAAFEAALASGPGAQATASAPVAAQEQETPWATAGSEIGDAPF